MSKLKAWYFSNEECALRYNDNRPIREGDVHSVEGEIVACKNGLHASTNILNALEYAPGPVLWRVGMSGDCDIGEDKVCYRHREYYKGVDVTDILRKFAKQCALDVIHLWNAPQVVVDYLNSDSEELRDAARGAGRGAGRGAAWDAARDAARGAAWGAAWDAARGAAWGAQEKRLLSMLKEVGLE